MKIVENIFFFERNASCETDLKSKKKEKRKFEEIFVYTQFFVKWSESFSFGENEK